jgi:hypothetical protein
VLVTRPIVRSFNVRFARLAARYVRSSGHAVVWSSPERATLVLPRPKRGDVHDLALWSLLDLGIHRFQVAKAGMWKGLVARRVPSDCLEIVRARAERDAVFPGPTRELELDCLACGACCKKNEVVLEKRDLQRFARAGLDHLARRPWARSREDGRVVLVLTRGGLCKHLGGDNKCDVYEARPAACSEFPAGCECCLYSREAELGVLDGERPSTS